MDFPDFYWFNGTKKYYLGLNKNNEKFKKNSNTLFYTCFLFSCFLWRLDIFFTLRMRKIEIYQWWSSNRYFLHTMSTYLKIIGTLKFSFTLRQKDGVGTFGSYVGRKSLMSRGLPWVLCHLKSSQNRKKWITPKNRTGPIPKSGHQRSKPNVWFAL